ncbi:hypothetical protein RFI_14416, partial [Reticulomyxa filosa]
THKNITKKKKKKKKKKRIGYWIIYGTLVGGFVCQMVVSWEYWKGTEIIHNGTRYCSASPEAWVELISAFWDPCISFVTTCLFICKLCQMQRRRSSPDDWELYHFWYSIHKYFTLASFGQINKQANFQINFYLFVCLFVWLVVGMMTTVLALTTLSLTGWVTCDVIDTNVSAWCIFLTYRVNQKKFDRLCHPCNTCLGKYCLHCCIEQLQKLRVVNAPSYSFALPAQYNN